MKHIRFHFTNTVLTQDFSAAAGLCWEVFDKRFGTYHNFRTFDDAMELIALRG